MFVGGSSGSDLLRDGEDYCESAIFVVHCGAVNLIDKSIFRPPHIARHSFSAIRISISVWRHCQKSAFHVFKVHPAVAGGEVFVLDGLSGQVQGAPLCWSWPTIGGAVPRTVGGRTHAMVLAGNQMLC